MEAYRDRARQLAGRSLVVGLSALSSAGSKVARAAVAGVGALTATDREKVTAVRFASLDGQGGSPVLLVAYETGFQVWSLENSSEPLELVSRRDGPVRLLDMLAPPTAPAMAGASGLPDSPLAGMHPVLVLAPGSTPAHPDPPPALRFYSLRSHATVHSLALSAPALALAASRRLLLISFPGQLAAFDAVTLEQKFTCLAYSPPSLPHPSVNSNGHEAAIPLPAAVPFALGPAWLAYPSPQATPCAKSGVTATRITPVPSRAPAARTTPSPAGGGHSFPAASDLARDAVQRSGRTLKAAGGAGYRYLSTQLAAWRGGQGHAAWAGAGIGAGPGPGSGAEGPVAVADALVPGTVVVREVGGLRVVAHFRAHTSALAALAFDPSGMLLATASTAGRSVRVWRVVTPSGRVAGPAPDATARPSPVQCLACLVRGLTPASIQGLAFSPDTRRCVAVSGRGTAHVFELPAGADAARPGADERTSAPPRLAAVGRARRPGLLRGSRVAAAADGAARAIAGAGPPPFPCVASWGAEPGSRLLTAGADGVLMTHEVPGPGARDPGAACPGPDADESSDGEAPGGASPAAPTSVPALREAERWDLGRRYGWLEREGEVAGSPGEDSDAAVDGERHADAAGVQEDGAASPRERQRWLAQVEPVWGYWPEPELALRAAVRLCPQGSAA
ncbi:hypothetical protein ACKKBF_B33395 [Auxenochlorella protothecoides x Auxenochlorella symbiontica]